MLEWLVQYWLQVLFGLFCGGIAIVAKFVWNTIKKEYIDVVKKNQEDILATNRNLEALQHNIDEKFEKLSEKMDYMQEESNASDLAMIRDSLLRKMRYGLTDGHCVKASDYETVTSLFDRYEKLGGNGAVHKLYEKYQTMHICPEHDDYDIEEEEE